MDDIISRRVEIAKSCYVVVSKHRNGRESRTAYTSDSFEKMLRDEAKRLEIRADLASSEKEREQILDKLDKHLFTAQVYGFPIRSKYELPRAGLVSRLYGVEHR